MYLTGRTLGTKVISCLCLLFILAISVTAQTPETGALTGTVTDSSGAVVPNATVALASANTGQVRTAVTGAEGVYRFNLLPPGNYRVTFAAAGFQTLEVPSVAIVVTETDVLDRSLAVGAQAQTVTVTAEVAAVQTASSTVGSDINDRTITELPLSTRNYTTLLAFTAGADAPVVNSASLGKASVNIVVNGADVGQNAVLQDGAAVNNWSSYNTLQEGTAFPAVAFPNPDSIEEFKIQTSTYDAGYGRNPGANINVVTKSGTNDFHGSAFEFLRNTAFNANDFFRNATVGQSGNDGSKQVLNQNQYGGVFGGPIKKDKLFFFVSYQETKQTNGVSGFGYSSVILPPIPTGNRGTCPPGFASVSQCDAPGQAFIQNLGAAVCPATHPSSSPGYKQDTTSVGGLQVACDGSNINPVAIKILQLQQPNGSYLLPSSGSTTGAYLPATFTNPAVYHDHQGMGNLDYLLNSKNTLSGRFYYENEPVVGNFSSSGTSLSASSYVPGDPVSNAKSNDVALLRLTTVASNSLINEARMSFQRNMTFAQQLTPFTDSQVGIHGVDSSQFDQLDTFIISGLFNFGSGMNFGAHTLDEQFQWADQVSWTRGKHSFRTGVEAERIQVDSGLPGATGIANPQFATFADFLIGRAACPAGSFGAGAGQCNAANPGTSNGTQSSNVRASSGTPQIVESPLRKTDLSAFIQDDIKVSTRLTVNAGVRWEYFGLPTSATGATNFFWPSVLNASPNPGSGCVAPNGVSIGAGASGTGCSLVGLVAPSNWNGGPLATGIYQSTSPYPIQRSAPWDNFAPRLGFAWQPIGGGRMVVRGGVGYFYDLVNGQYLGGFDNGQPYSGSLTAGPTSTLANQQVLSGVLPGPPGTFGYIPRWVNLATGASSNIAGTTLAQNFTTPVTYEWNLDVQYEFLPSWVLDVGYVGSHGIHQVEDSQIGTGANTPYNFAQLVSPSSPAPISGVTTNTVANATLRVPYLGVATTAPAIENFYSYRYDALQTTLRKQMSHGLQFQIAYTWTNAMQSTAYGTDQAPYIVQAWGPNTQYHPQRVVAQYVWNIPSRLRGIEGKVLNHWTFSGVTTMQSGNPVSLWDSRGGTVFFGSQTATTSLVLQPAEYCPGMGVASVPSSGSNEQRVTTGWFNNSSGIFCAPPVLGQDGVATGYGDSGIGTVFGPGQQNWDVGLSKLMNVGGLRESATLQFRAEVFNAFNHPNFNLPSQNSNVSNPQLNVSSPSFGIITNTSTSPRIMQFALKYSF